MQSFLVTNIQLGNFEDLANFIQRISYGKAPFLNLIGTVKAKAITHDWMTQALRAAASNAAAEGFTPSFAAANNTARVRRTNQVQVLKQEFSVSNTQEYVDKAGLGQSSEYEEQKDLKMIEITKDADFALIQSTIVSRDADAGTASQLRGLNSWAGFNQDGTGTYLSQDMFEALTRQIWTSTGETTDNILVTGFQRRMVTTWTTNFKQFDMQGTNMIDTVETYRGDWGSQSVLADPHQTESTVTAFRAEFLKKAYLRPIAHYELGQTIDGRRGYVVMEVTLEARNPNTIGTITGLKTS